MPSLPVPSEGFNLSPSGSGGGSPFRLSGSAISSFGGAVSDLFAADAYRFKAQGDQYEKENYQLAAQFADQNVQYTEWSTAIKQMQEDRELSKSLGETRADVAGAGFAASGSALDLLRESASQGAIARAVTGEQGLITEAGYKEQADSYRNMAAAAQVAIDAENKAAKGAEISAIFKFAAGAVSMLNPASFAGAG
jgi:hypothetical protein